MNMHNPAHPGEVLSEEWLKPLRLTVADAARRIGISRKHLSNITNGNAAITADIALRLEALTGSSPDLWLKMQVAYDLWKLRDKKYTEIERVA